jgi:saccharopine dehydrogenase-like NADP-dependent oxidoreductase
MKNKVVILGGQGRIGYSVAQDLLKHTDAEIVITGRKQKRKDVGDRIEFLALDLEDRSSLKQVIANSNLVVHCAGPFRNRDDGVLKTCLEEKVNYIDVSDRRSFYEGVIRYRQEAIDAGVTAILNTGIFPGISNSMVRQGVEQLDESETIHLSYVVAGSGGAGLTVMRTTFLGLRKPFEAWLDRRWQKILPYTQRELIEFPQPYGKTGVYWFDVPETYTFPESFPQAKNVITKFGSVPDFYNHLTWITAHVFPHSWIESPTGTEFFSRVSYRMTNVTDRFTGVGVAMRSEITGNKDGKKAKYIATMVHENTAIAAGCGTGSVAQFMLEKRLTKPGIWPVERVLPTDLFTQAMASRGIKIEKNFFCL